MVICPKCQASVAPSATGCQECGFVFDNHDGSKDPNRPTIDKYGNVIVKLGAWGAFARFFDSPLMIIGLIFAGPPGWILIMLHSKACDKMRAMALELANKSESLRAAGHLDEAQHYATAVKENFKREWRPDRFK